MQKNLNLIFVHYSQKQFEVPRWNDRCHALVNSLEDERVCIIAPVCQKVLCPESRNQLRCSCAIRCGTRIAPAYHAHPRPNVSWCCAPFCTTHRLVSAPCASGVGMYFDMAGIDHQTFKVCVIHQGFQNLFSDSLVTPPAKPAVYILLVSIRFWQVPPRCPGTQNPEYTVDKLPGITGISSACPLFSNGVWPDFLPCSIAHIVSMLFHRLFSALLYL